MDPEEKTQLLEKEAPNVGGSTHQGSLEQMTQSVLLETFRP